MYLLDTNVVSMLDPARQKYEPALVDWLDRNGTKLFLSVMTITEMERGVLKLRREGKIERAAKLSVYVSEVFDDYSDRVLPLDLEAARHLARLQEETHQQQVPLPDLIIAATAARHDLVVLTRNMKDFGRLSVKAVDPFLELPEDA